MAMGCTIGAVKSITIGANGSPLAVAPFFVAVGEMALMAIIPNRNDPFTGKSPSSTPVLASFSYSVESPESKLILMKQLTIILRNEMVVP